MNKYEQIEGLRKVARSLRDASNTIIDAFSWLDKNQNDLEVDYEPEYLELLADNVSDEGHSIEELIADLETELEDEEEAEAQEEEE